MRPDQIKGFVSTPGRPVNPLGGREMDGFGSWVGITHVQMADMAAQFLPGDTGDSARLCREARDHYSRIRHMLERARNEVTEHSRDHLETELIHDVIAGHGWAAYARERTEAGLPPEGKRAYVHMTGAYLRACMVLAQYTGAGQIRVAECGDDQDALIALGRGSTWKR